MEKNFIIADVGFEIQFINEQRSEWDKFYHTVDYDKVMLEISIKESLGESISLSAKGNTILFSLVDKDVDNYLLNAKLYELCAPTLIENGVIHLHSSFVLYNGKAVLFTGPSGIGKTTQAELWRDYLGATIVNGDVSLIRKIDGTWTAFGAPIHGSSPYCENMQAPIVGVVALSQGEENHIERMGGYEALCFCMQEIYRPEMSEETQEILLESMDGFFSEIPVYHMTCRPDEESVMLVKKELNM